MSPTGLSELAKKRCQPCEGGIAPLSYAEANELLTKLRGWTLADSRLEREFVFKNFVEAMKFVTSIAALAEEEGHHPDLHIHYNRVRVELWTHAVSGLTQNDFILAAKIDELN